MKPLYLSGLISCCHSSSLYSQVPSAIYLTHSVLSEPQTLSRLFPLLGKTFLLPGLIPTTSYYSLDLECPLKSHILKAWSPLGGGGDFRRWGHEGGVRSWGVCPWRGYWNPKLFFSLFFASWTTMNWAVLHQVLFTTSCLVTGTKATGPRGHGLKSLKPWAK
jgi:hypothetical protein